MRYPPGYGALLVVLVASSLLRAQVRGQETNERQFIDQSQELIRTGRLSEADRVLKDAVRAYAQSGGLYNLVGVVAAEQNRQSDAETAFRKAVQYSPALTPALLNLARVLYSEGKKDEAIHTYRRAIRLDNHLEEAHANLAALLLDKEDYVGARQQLAALPDSDQTQNRFLAMAAQHSLEPGTWAGQRRLLPE
jgi:Flp pilus assembly protein TadD